MTPPPFSPRLMARAVAVGMIVVAGALPTLDVFADGANGLAQFLQSRREPAFAMTAQAAADPEPVAPGQEFTLRVRVAIPAGWHIYSLTLPKEQAELASRIHFKRNVFRARGVWTESPAQIAPDEVLQTAVKMHAGAAEFSLRQQAPAELRPGSYSIEGVIVYRACDNKLCSLPKEEPFRAEVRVVKG